MQKFVFLSACRRSGRLLMLCIVAAALVGCGAEGEFETAPVHGIVTYQGEPVEGGSITFRPLATGDQQETGKPASGEIQSDGAYTLRTYGDADGAVIGKHQVLYSAPYIEPEEPLRPGESAPRTKWHGLAPKENEVQVTEGDNEIDIELVAPR